jgi:hypothetical protein
MYGFSAHENQGVKFARRQAEIGLLPRPNTMAITFRITAGYKAANEFCAFFSRFFANESFP